MDLELIREIQLKQLNILKILVELLEAEKINYFLIGGSALGAIRHQGFIPWDDDIDIAMLRDDYERFLALQEKLPENLKIYNFEKDKKFPLIFSKIYDMDTPYYCHSNRKNDVPRKIFIDIFPWDNIYQVDQLTMKIEKLYIKFRRAIFKPHGTLFDKLKFPIYRILYGLKDSSFFFSEIQKANKDSLVKPSTTWGYVLESDVLEYDDIFPLRKAMFEGIEVYIPNKCEQYLEKKYGDYMTMPPEKDRVNHSRGKFIKEEN